MLPLPLVLFAAAQESPAEALLREAKALERVAESQEMQRRALPDRLAAIDEAVAKFRQARASPGADAALIDKAILTEEDLHWRAGNDWMYVGRFDKARARYETSIETCRGARDERHSRIARTRAAIAHLEIERGRLAEAEKEVEEAERELAAGAGESLQERRVHAVKAARARLDFKSGRHDAGVLHMGEAVRAAREAEMPGYAVQHVEDLGELLLDLGRADRAVAVLEEAFAWADRDDRRARVAAWLALALVRVGRAEEALAILDAEVESLLPTTSAFSHLAARALNFRVQALLALGRAEEARRVLEEQWGRFEEAGAAGRALGLGFRILVAWECGRAEEAVALREAYEQARRSLGKGPHSSVVRALGAAKVSLGLREEGLALLRRAFASCVRWIARFEGGEDVASSLGVVVRAAEDLLDVLVGREGSSDPEIAEEAFRAIEASKAEALRRALLRSSSGEPSLDPDLEERRRALYRQSSLVSARMVERRGTEKEGALRAEREDLERQAEDLERAFRTRHPLAGSVRGFDPVSLGEFQASLGSDVVALDYLVGEREVFALVVWREGARIVRVGSPGLLREACRTVGALHRDATVEAATLLDAARGLSGRLLEGPLDGLEGIRRLVVLPDGPLHTLAFEALPSPFGPGFLIEAVEVAYVPCASALLALRQGTLDPEGLRFLGVAETEGLAATDAARDGPATLRAGLGPLPRAGEEVRAAAALAGGEPTLLLGRAATPEALEALDLRGFGILHFAAHGVPDEETPGRSGLLLHDGADPDRRAVLEARAISGLTLRADLAVLSACRTGGGRIQAGEGVRSLARSFLEAGSRSVLLTLWEVSDSVCLAFMDLFYGALREGASKGEALRRAKIESLRASGSRAGLRTPSAWAGFVLVGDAEGKIPLKGTRHERGTGSAWLVLAGLVAGGGTFLLARRGGRGASSAH